MTGVCLTKAGTLTTAILSHIFLTELMVEIDLLGEDSDSESQ